MNQFPSLADFVFHMQKMMDKVEVIQQPLWDTVIYPSEGTERLTAFVFPFGSGEKTQHDTNMVLSGCLPMPQAFYINSIVLASIDSIPYNVLRNGRLELMLGTKPYFNFAPMAALCTLEEGLTTMAHKIEPGLGIVSGQNFCVEMRWIRALRLKQDAKIRVQLNGWFFRAVM